MTRFGRLPLTVRIPLSVALLFLIVSTALISLSLHGLSRQFDRQIDDLGQVYLDGLASAVLPAVREGDRKQIHDVLNRALDTHVGVVDRTLAILAENGDVLAHVSRYDEVEDIPFHSTVAMAASGTRFELHANGVWAWRELDAAHPELGMAIANLDVGDFVRQRGELAVELILVGLGISVAGACLGFVVARRLQRPIMLLTARLRAAHGEQPRLLGPATHAHDPEMAELLAAYDWMAQGVREREALASRQARMEREALLGRMSAALAHEVRNPLGGMRTALQTLRQFGDDAEARRESLDFVARGVEALQAVVDASLRTFRPGDAHRLLRGADLHDVRLLVQAQANRQAVTVLVDSDWPDADAPVLPAAPVRQLLLNLVLNAVAASPHGATVWVSAQPRARALAIHVLDQGPGLPAQAKAMLQAGTAPAGERMGLGIVCDLVRGLGGRLRAHGGPRRGTCISVWLPYWPLDPS
ncbi:ATP-binding protein [Achromobacter aloeverae]